ncbi:MAG: ABC transporter ATP-binding protein [Nitrososphaerota archaeon]|nr:ABC transporter ATP-binding protein [Nitrososphaerota archaeon]MDG6983133.1 ABC transporter ATP-binding protein [Nitrososphaerota archaeon]
MAMIQFKDVAKSFKDVYAVRGVTCDIEDQEIFGLLGPNGAGKTTLIMTMATVYNPTRGEVVVDGHSASAEPDKVKSLIGISFQDPKYDRILSAREILQWHAKVTGVEKGIREKRIDDVLAKFGLAGEAKKRTWMLSGGTKKKIENAKVFVQRPKIAVFDEPTAYLDVPSRLMVWDMIDELRDGGTTVVLATNMMDEADRMSDRVGIMSRGEMVQVGEPARLKGTLKGRDIIEMKLEAPIPELVGEVKQVEEVKDAHFEGDLLKVALSNGRELLPHMINLVTAKGGKVQSVNLKEPSLEDVFLHYTGTTLT